MPKSHIADEATMDGVIEAMKVINPRELNLSNEEVEHDESTSEQQ